jgi:amino acid adenylation domain-containing protein
VAGEACRRDVFERHLQIVPRAAFYNEYGPTECSVWCAAGEIRAADVQSTSVGIGRAVAGTRVVIVDDRGGLTPLTVAGELYVGGAGVVRGYFDRPDLTAEKFVPDPFGAAGERLYRSGDRARYRVDGVLEFLGRDDDQVKIRGHRVEISEVEEALSRLPDIREAAAVARADAAGDMRLIAYVVGVGDIDSREVKDAVRRAAPDYLTPQFIVPVDRLPRLENGKIARRALPTPDLDALIADRFVAPVGEAETLVCVVFAEALGLARVGAEDDFFDLGGDSIRAIQAASGFRSKGYRVAPRDIFQHPTAVSLATRLRPTTELEIAAAGNRRAAPFALDPRDVERVTRLYDDVVDVYPLTPMQEGLLFHAISQSGTGLYLMQDRYEIKGRLDVDAFADAWRSVVTRHDILRSSFDWSGEGRPCQIVHHSAILPFETNDLSTLPEEKQIEEIDRDLAAERARGFDLSAAPLMRIRVYRLAAARHICVRSFHHIILDDWCTSPLILDVRRHYAAASRGERIEPPRPPQFGRYIEWIEAKSLDAAEKFWRGYLDGFVEPTPLVGGRRPQVDAAVLVEDVIVDLPDDIYDLAKALALRNRLTMNTFVQGALALTLGRAAGVDDVVFGVTVSGRPTDLEGAESTLGLFINSLPLRVRIDPLARVVDWLREILSDNLDIRQYEFVSQTKIQQWSAISRSSGLLFQHLLTFENAPLDPSVRGEKDVLDIDLLQLRVHTNYPLTFVAIPGERLSLRVTYDREHVDDDAARRSAQAFRRALEQLIVKCDRRLCELDLLEPAERETLTVAWNETERDYGDPLDFVARFEARAAADGDRVAASCGAASIRFAELNGRANRLAHALIDRGVGPDVVVGVLDDRGIDFLVAIVAIFKSGGAYLPLDPAHPDARIAQVLAESAAPLLGVGATYLARARGLVAVPLVAAPRVLDLAALEAAESRMSNPLRRHCDGGLAFVIYTSGSTGKPKGAMVEHRGMFNNLITKVPALVLTRDDVVAQTASQCFDISVWQFLTALTIGARVEIFPDDISRDPERLLDRLDAKRVTIFETVPSMIRALLDVTDGRPSLRNLRWLLPCGEAFGPELCRLFMERFPHVRLLNAYGPAECSDDVSYYPIDFPPEGNDLSVPIGRAVDNTRLYLVDRWLELAPVGAAGEICVAGLQVGRGYLHRPDLTAACFLPDPFSEIGGRLYHTGDLGRRRPDGVIEFLGRIDHQVKIRGNRVEPGEVEARLASHPDVRASCVVIREIAKGVHRLIAYVECAADKFSSEELRLHIRATLPAYMVPEAFVRLDALPLSPNGKIDRKALPAPALAADVLSRHIAPRNFIEETIAQIWTELLGAPNVGVNDNFFELGGHSLLAARIVSRIRSIFAIELPLRALLESPDLADLAARVDAARGRASTRVSMPIVRASRSAPTPLSNAQQRLWFMQQRDPSSSAYHFTVAVRVAGALDGDLLEAALNVVVQRHESLRTVFVTENGGARQKILADLTLRIHRQVVDAAIDTKGETGHVMSEFAGAPFDLERGPLVRCALYRSSVVGVEGPSAAVLLCFHHIIFDGWSFTVFLREFAAIYSALRAGRDPALPPLTIQYADYSAWHAEQLQGSAAAEHLAYWREHLRGAPPRLDLPTDRPRNAAVGYDAASHALELAELQQSLDGFDRARAVTPFMTLLSAFATLLRYLSGASDLVIGTDVANRPRIELESVIGFFVNLVALRVRLDGDPTFEELVERVRALALSAYDHQSFPFDRLVEALRPDRDAGYPPIFQTKVAFHNVPTLELDIGELEVEPMSLESSHAELDLVLHVYQRREGLGVVFEYRSGLFAAATIDRFAELFRTVLQTALQRPQIGLGELLEIVATRDITIQDAIRSKQLAARHARLGRVERRNMFS